MSVNNTFNAAAVDARETARNRSTGRFGKQVHSTPETGLQPSIASDLLAQRAAQLAEFGFVPANPQLKLAEATSQKQWWDRTSSISEEGQYATMTAEGAGGKRAQLRVYEGSETTVRMPSASAVRRYAREHGTTFDMPVEAITPHGPITGHVRVTAHGAGRYSVSGVRMPPEHGEYVAESVLATLEARRPSRGLNEVRDILKRRRERIAAGGARMREVPSSWIRAVGYNPVDNQLVMNLQGRMYGYRVPPETYQEMMNAKSIGSAYNHLVKRVAPTYEVEQHEACGNYFYAGAEHRCPSYHEEPALAGAR